MKENFKAILLILLIFLVIFATSWNAIKLKIDNHSKNYKPTKINLISTIHPKFKNFVKTLYFTGKVEPVKKIKIISQLNGEIIKIFANNGDYVKKEDNLFKIGGKLIENKVKLLQTKIKVLNKRIIIAKKILKLKRLSFSNRLIKKDELLSSELDLLNLKSNLRIIVQKLNKIRKLQTIKAPISGIFIKNFISVGQIVNKGDILGKIVSTDELKIVGKVFIKDSKVLLNKIAIIDNKSFKINKIFPFKDQNGKTIFWIKTKNFTAGEFIQGKIILSNDRILSIPEKAIIYDEKSNAWIFKKEKNEYKKVKIKTGLSQYGWVQVLSGVNKSDEIVVNGAYELFYKHFAKSFKVED